MSNAAAQSHLVLAAINGDVQGIDRALAAGALIDVDDVREPGGPGWGYTPLQAAAFADKEAAFERLLQLGADIHAVGTKPDPVAWLSVQRNRDARILVRAIEAGADLAWRSTFDRTLLHLAAYTGCVDALRVLLAQGFDADLREADGHTSMHEAALAGNADCLLALAQAGADIEAVSTLGSRSMDLVAAGSSESAACMMVALGARTDGVKSTHPQIQACLMRQPMECAFMTGEPQALLWCLDHGAHPHTDQLREWMNRCAQAGNESMADFLCGLMAQHEARRVADQLAVSGAIHR